MTQIYRDEHLLLISLGNVCRQWSYLEFTLARIVWYFLGLNKEQGIEVTGRMEILPLLDMAIRLAEDCGHPLQVEFNKLKACLPDLKERRNRVVHGTYMYFKEDDVMLLEHHRQRRKADRIHSDEIMAMGKEIHEIASQIATGMETFTKPTPTFPPASAA